MTCRPLLPLLLLIGALLAAAAITGASPTPQSSVTTSEGKDVAEAVLKRKPTSMSGTSAEKKPSASNSEDSSKIQSVIERPTEKPAIVGTTKKPEAAVASAGDTEAESPTEPPTQTREAPTPAANNSQPETASTKAANATTTEPTTEMTTESATTEEPSLALSAGAETVREGDLTTSPPGFTVHEILTPVCALIVDTSLESLTFDRRFLDGFTTCQCLGRERAACEPTSRYPTVRPGSAAAAHAQEQSGGGRLDVLAANVWAMRHDCQQRARNGTVCYFGLLNGQLPYCDCSVDV